MDCSFILTLVHAGQALVCPVALSKHCEAHSSFWVLARACCWAGLGGCARATLARDRRARCGAGVSSCAIVRPRPAFAISVVGKANPRHFVLAVAERAAGVEKVVVLRLDHTIDRVIGTIAARKLPPFLLRENVRASVLVGSAVHKIGAVTLSCPPCVCKATRHLVGTVGAAASAIAIVAYSARFVADCVCGSGGGRCSAGC